MPSSIKIGNSRICIGDRLRATERAFDHEICGAGTLVSVVAIECNQDDLRIGLYSNRSISNWGDLDGLVPFRRGFWANRDCILDNFVPFCSEYVINNSDVKFRGRSLNGMLCKILHVDRITGNIFVELDEHIGAGHADGLGKKGHCVVVTKEVLKKIPTKKILNWTTGD